MLQRIASQALTALDFAEDDVIFIMGAFDSFFFGGWVVLFVNKGLVEVLLR